MTSRAELPTETEHHKSLADVERWLISNSAIPPRWQEDRLSALRTLSRATGKPLNHLPAHAGAIRRVIDQLSPAQFGMKTKSFRNFKSRIFTLLDKAGCPVVRGRYLGRFPEPWQKLWDALDKHRSLRYHLSHIMHWHCARDISPDQAGSETFAAYCKDAVEFGTKENRHRYYKQACVAWNRAGEVVPAWPKARVEVPRRRKLKSHLWTMFDPALEREVKAYLATLRKSISPSAAVNSAASRPWRRAEGGRKRKPLRDETVDNREYQIRLFASYAYNLGIPLDRLRSLADLVSLEVVGRVVDHLWEVAGQKPTTYIAGYAWTMRAIARDMVKVDAQHLEKLDEICAFVTPQTKGMTPKNRSRLDQLRDPAREQDLRWLPNNLADRARKAKHRTICAARIMADACKLGLLMYCPMRRRNLAELRIDEHLRRIPNGRSTTMLIEIPGGKVKNGVPTRYPVPDEIAEMICDFLAYYRPLICPVDSPWLFPTSTGKAIHRNALSTGVSKLIWRETGLRWNAHLFRHWDGETYIEEQPGDYETLRRFLHHEDQESSRSYIGIESEAAIRHFQDVILKRRARLSKPARRAA